MSLPFVQLNRLDGQTGVLPPIDGRPIAVVGPATLASSGSLAVDTPASFGRKAAMLAEVNAGPAAELAALVLDAGISVVLVRTGTSVAGSFGALTTDLDGVGGVSEMTIDTGTEPNDDYDILIEFVSGGTIGVTGITYRTSSDGGKTKSALTALGTATSITVPDTGGVTVDLAAGTIAAGASGRFFCVAPEPNGTEIASALTALKNYAGDFSTIWCAFPITSTTFDNVEAGAAAMHAKGKFVQWYGNVRLPTAGESESSYASAQSGFAAKATILGALGAGACDNVSAISGRKYRRPIIHPWATREATIPIQQNAANPALGALNTSITDEQGNPLHHNEEVHGGLDDLRFTTLRTIEGENGIYLNRSRMFSPDGSDFRLTTHGLVFNLGMSVTRKFFIRRINSLIRVDANTGYILELDATDIELGLLNRLRAAGMFGTRASAAYFTLSRTDNLLSTFTLTGDLRIVPLAYGESYVVSVGFYNPALLLQAA